MSRTHSIVDGILLWAMLPNFPKVPDHLVDAILSTIEPSPVPREYHARGVTHNQVELVTHVMTPISAQCLSWTQTHIDPGVTSVWNAGFPAGHAKVPAHTDARRSHGINYIITTGSVDPVVTQFYKPLAATKVEIQPHGLWFVDESELELIDQVEFEPGTWWYINTRVIHGTACTNLTSQRNIFGIGYRDEPSLEIQNLLNNISKGN